MRYETLDLRIARESSGRLVVWADWAFGHGSDRVVVDDPELHARIEALQEGTASAADLEAIGTLLYDRLFRSEDGDVGEQLNQCWGAAKKDRSSGIRIRLRFDDPHVGAIPWELLYWPTRGSWFAASRRTALERYLEVPDVLRQPQAQMPVRVLVVSPAVEDLDTRTEIEHLRSVLDDLDDVEYEILEGVVTGDRIRSALREREAHVLHFIGHGGVDDEGPYLLVNGPDGTAPIDDEQLADVLHEHPALQLVVLNSCEGAVGSPAGPFVGIAQRLVSRGLPAVLGMQFPIFDKVALRFSAEFYSTLFAGRTRGDVEVATAAARSALRAEFPSLPAFAAPVLFLHTDDGVLFDFVTGSLVRDIPIGVQRARALKSVRSTLESNLRLRTERAGETPSDEARSRIEADARALRNIRRRLRTGTVLALMPVVLALLLFTASVTYLLDQPSRWVGIETLTVRVAETLDTTPLDDALAIVAIDENDVAAEGEPFGRAWRPRLGALVDRLSRAGASVVALDMDFEPNTPLDSTFAAALAAARARGTRVIVGAHSLDGERPRVADALRPHVDVGVACGASGAHQVVALAVVKTEGDGTRRVLPSLPLQALAAFRGLQVVDTDLIERRIVLADATRRATVEFASATDPYEELDPACTLIEAGDMLATFLPDYSDPGSLRDSSRRFGYTEIVRSTTLPTRLSGKLVVVGSTTGDVRVPLYPGLGGEQRYGFEILADAINSLLQGTGIRPIGWGSTFLLILAFALAGAVVAIVPARARLRTRMAVLIVLALALFLVAVQAYRSAGRLIMVVYPGLALLLGFWGTRTFDRWRLS